MGLAVTTAADAWERDAALGVSRTPHGAASRARTRARLRAGNGARRRGDALDLVPLQLARD
ncbi:MAG: hypothetical protein ACM35G_11690, partial [Planctomycetaceae bacterium]